MILDRSMGYDHKRKVALNPLTYLAWYVGVRTEHDLQGEFTDEEILHTWVGVKTETTRLSDDATVPRRAFLAAAKEMGIATEDDIESVERTNRYGTTYTQRRLPDELWNKTVGEFPNEYGVDSGYNTVVMEDDFIVVDDSELTQDNSYRVFAERFLTDEGSESNTDGNGNPIVATSVAWKAYAAFCHINDIDPKSNQKQSEMLEAVGADKGRRRINDRSRSAMIGATLTNEGWGLYKNRDQFIPNE